MEDAERRLAKWERRLKWEERGGPRSLEEVARETIIDIRYMIEDMPSDFSQTVIEEWRAFLIESSVRLENLLHQSPLRYAALADELKRFRNQIARFRPRLSKAARILGGDQ